MQSGALAIFASIQRTNKASLATFGAEGFVRIGFIGLLTIFGWNVFIFYRDTWFALGEIVVMFSRCVVV